ncbi:aminodeoxychorismate synthase component I [Bacteroidia bacterium]|nr:aminodeoxychorismate synthase component I [Bacteroidia bacterium]
MNLNLYNDIDHIRVLMNRCGEEGIPFVFILNFELTEGYFIENPLAQDEILFRMGDVGNQKIPGEGDGPNDIEIFPLSLKDYKKRFDVVRNGLYSGNSFLTNLTVRTKIRTDLSLNEIFNRSSAPYSLYVPGRFVCFSPERFVKIENGQISTNPMKGTIDASIPDAGQLILDDFKEKAEHNTIVDLLRNDLSLSATNVHVSRFRYIEKIKARNKEILQVSSEIKGTLSSDYREHLGDIIFKMLPAGSISGAPKASTVRLIQEAEKEPRGYYTGIAGYFDGDMLDSAVLIRFIEEYEGKMYFRSGGGITAYSDWEEEYREVLNKIYLPFI